jgi:hypothetical protein
MLRILSAAAAGNLEVCICAMCEGNLVELEGKWKR